MAKELKFGACLPTFASCADRFVLSGYGGGATTVTGMIELAGSVKAISGIELVGNWHVREDNINEIKEALEKAGLEVPMMVPDLWTQAKWGRGSLTAKDEKTRQEAIAEVKKNMDLAAEMGCNMVDLWLGQDGFDYPFQTDYTEAWDKLVEGTRECADYRGDITVCIEYKIKEPRTHLHVGTVGKTVLLIDGVARPNVGALIDVGHAYVAGENVAESIAILTRGGKNRLAYVHFNDNYRFWDDDMMVGSVHTIELLEILYWLERIGYGGWYTLDIFPYREDGVRAATESIEWIKGLRALLEKLGSKRIERVIAMGDATEASAMLREALLS